MYPTDDTIVAIASAPGASARGIVRLSGPRSHELAAAGVDDLRGPADHRSGRFTPWPPGGSLPVEVLLWPAGRSYTAQQVAEMHLLGSPPVLDAMLERLVALGARLAEPGEFTLRAFLAGRIDLTQAEAVLGVIDADDPVRLEAALRQLSGGLGDPLRRLLSDLVDLLADLEAGFDFAEEDIAFIHPAELHRRLEGLAAGVSNLLERMSARSDSQTAMVATLIGPPGAGKSSLFNALLGSDVALVDAAPGTTRDYLVREINAQGLAVRLVDTAGRSTANGLDEIDALAQLQTDTAGRLAEVVIHCVDATTADPSTVDELFTTLDDGGSVNRVSDVRVLTKCDLIDWIPPQPILATSAATGEGIDRLHQRLFQLARGDLGREPSDVVTSTAQRCRHLLEAARDSLRRAIDCHGLEGGEELVATELRVATDELGRVVGTVYTEDVLERLFSRFCVGK